MSTVPEMASPRAMRGYLEITRNTLSIILRSKVLYLVLFLTVVIAALSVLPFLMIQMASEAGEAETVRGMQEQSVVGIFGFWSAATSALALFLGATAISSEVKAKTIVTVLSKPVDRWKFLVAKWVGIETFLLAFFAVGILVVATVILVFEAHVSTLFWLGVARGFLTVMILSTAALALSTVASPVFSGGLPILLSMVSEFAAMYSDGSTAVVRIVTKAFFLLMPAPMPRDLLAQGFSSEPLNPEWSLYFQVMLENAGYSLVLLGLACFFFSSRELRLK